MHEWMLGGALLAALLFLLKFIFHNSGKVLRVNYQKRDFLFSSGERAFLKILDEAVGETWRVFGRIPVTDVLVSRNLDKDPEARKLFDTLESRRFSFIVCDKNDLGVICALQVDDVPPAPVTAKRSGDVLANLCESAGLALIRIDSRKLQDAATLRELIQSTRQRDALFAVETDGRREPRFSSFEDLEL
jgi:hypothetical protein